MIFSLLLDICQFGLAVFGIAYIVYRIVKGITEAISSWWWSRVYERTFRPGPEQRRRRRVESEIEREILLAIDEDKHPRQRKERR